MSTINSKNVQVGTSGVANQNFTLYQPDTPDGTVRLGVGNSGVTTSDVVTVTNAGNMTVSGVATATTFSGSGASLTALNASNLSSGTIPDARFPATLPAASGVNLTNLNASNLATGTVGTARLGSGTANNTTFLRGDGTWATAGGDPTTAQVLSATAGASAGAVGSYMFAKISAGTTVTFGSTTAGSNLRPTGALTRVSQGPSGGWEATSSGTQSGTWRCMGYHDATTWGCGTAYLATVWLRIS